MNQENPPPYSAAGYAPPPGMPGYSTSMPPPPPPGLKPDFTHPQQEYPQQEYHHPNVQTSATHVIISSGPVTHLGPNPQNVVCPSCHAQICTSVTTEPNSKTHMFALLLCLFQCWLCCCIPYCVDSCQSQNHHCPNCGAFIGSYSN